MPLTDHLPTPLAAPIRATTVTYDEHRVEMPDGARLGTRVYRPGNAQRVPAVLIRTPYGMTGITGVPVVVQARWLAALGYAVVVQDVRGRFGSEGEFIPAIDERTDGARTVEWVRDQPWFAGGLMAWGISYVGATAWAASAGAPGQVDALALGATHSRLGLPDPRGILHVETSMRWIRSLHAMVSEELGGLERARILLDARRADQAFVAALRTLPVLELDRLFLGRSSPVWRAWADHPDPEDPYWAGADHSGHRDHAPPTVHSTGWWDLFVHHQIPDHDAQATVRPTGLVVGPWGHMDPRQQTTSMRLARRHADVHLRGADPGDGPPTRVWVSGAEGWWSPAAWPPPTTARTWYGAHGRLTDGASEPAAGATLVYDPTDPTPTLAGRTLTAEPGARRLDGRLARPDLLIFDSEPVERPTLLAGAPTVTVPVTADTGLADLSVVLAQVDPDARCVSICEGFTRIHDAGDVTTATVELHPVCHLFDRGTRLRLIVAGGSFPAHDRNLGHGVADPRQTTIAGPTRMVLPDGLRLSLPLAT